MTDQDPIESASGKGQPVLRNPRVENAWRLAASDEMIRSRVVEERRKLEAWGRTASNEELIEGLVYFAGECQRLQILLTKESHQAKAFLGVASKYLSELRSFEDGVREQRRRGGHARQSSNKAHWAKLEHWAERYREANHDDLETPGAKRRFEEELRASRKLTTANEYGIGSVEWAVRHLWAYMRGKAPSKVPPERKRASKKGRAERP